MPPGKAGGLFGERLKGANKTACHPRRPILPLPSYREVPVLGITAEYICLTVKVITTNLKLLKQQDWCERQIIHARKAGMGVKKSIIHEAFYPPYMGRE